MKKLMMFLLMFLLPTAVFAEETIKVGVLHSLSGTMAISETSLKDVALMAIEEINDGGGLLGKQLEPVVVDPAITVGAAIEAVIGIIVLLLD